MVAVRPDQRVFVGLDHVTVARGRDYTDVSPLKGVYSGAADSTLDRRGEFHPAALTRIPWCLP